MSEELNLTGHKSLEDKREFQQWYTTHAFDYQREPIGSLECSLQRKAWIAARAELLDEIEALRKQRNELGNMLWMAEDQWSNDYLWEKWCLSAPLTDELKNELDMGIRK